jgi:hypothetical protein
MLGRPPSKPSAPAAPAGTINLTDLDSRPVKGPRGFLQGYNAQAVATAGQIVIACDLVAR